MKVQVKDLVGRVIENIEQEGRDELRFIMRDGDVYLMHHVQDCCEGVYIEDISGELDNIIGEPLTMADESTNSDNPPDHSESHTWTFYKFATIKGFVDIRWLGESNGYYSEGVDFVKVS